MSGRVMIVEDDEDIVDAIRFLLDREGYHVSAAPDGQSALAALAADPLPSVILLDLMMPVMTGYEFREAQLADPRLAAVPVVLMTADGHIEEKRVRLGVDAALGKPFGIENLLSAVKRFVGE